MQRASIAGQDVGKYWAILLLIIGAVLSLVGSDWLVNILKV